jgi:peroxiredoxin Q/BCP
MKKLLILLIVVHCNLFAAENWVGKPAPKFDLPDQDGIFHTLKEYQGKWLVLYFYPKDDTPGCTIEAKSFTSDYQAIEKLGAVVVGVSLDDIESHKTFATKYNIPYTLLADKDEIMSTAYNVVKNIPLMHYAKRQTFVINPQGIIVKFYENVSPKSHTAEVISDLKELKENKK